MRLAIPCLLAFSLFPSAPRAQAPDGVPVFEIMKEDSEIQRARR